ncbi:hypothetical protein NW766_006014 [Fusarium irregulare]|uniref:HNH nuclease domain-containing protein n=1 Tax=Fusarium irregulare TaxID=2494466 RepID=A0A9W8PP47_9HYPO|nr:hypothetical protein NW766_006014 [Fusarium irregulare]
MDPAAETPFALPYHLRTSTSIDYGVPGPSRENEERLKCAKALESFVQIPHEEFRLYCEHAAAILLADIKQLRKGGRLWADPSSRVPARMMRNRLNRISPFCRHYMLHLNPKNLTAPHWKHAVPVPLERQPEPENVPWDEGVEAYEKAMAYHSRFQTGSDLQSVPLYKQQMEEAKCRERDEDKCLVTGRPKPRVFWIIPSTWNNTVENMDATGNLHTGCRPLTGIDLLDGPNPPCSVNELGTTHYSWNMMCIDRALYNYLNDGWCAFKYLFHRDHDNDNFKVTLGFHWMPKLEPLFGQPIDINIFWTLFSAQMEKFDNCPPPPGLEYGQVRDKSGELLKSGYRFDVLVPKQYVGQFQSGIDVHWACIRFTALCGAAGRPWLLSGMDPEDDTMQDRQKNAVLQDSQELGWRAKTYGMLKDAGKQVGGTIKDTGKQVGGTLKRQVTRTGLSDIFSAGGTSSAVSDSTSRRGRRGRSGSEN